MSRLQTEIGSPIVKPSQSRSLMHYIFNDEPLSKKGRLAIPSRGVQTSIESADKMPDGGAKDTFIHEISNKYQYESKLEGNEGAPLSNYKSIHSEHFAYIMFEPTRYEKELRPYINAYGPTLRIPVSPATLSISKESSHNEVQSIMFGGILERNAPGLRHFSVTSFIPGTPYTTGYGDYRFQNYYPWAEDLGGNVRVYTNGTLDDDNLICTQTGWISFVNLLMDRRIILKFHLIKAPAFRHRDECFNVCIKSFTYQHNPHDDLDYTIEFVEWREPTIRIGEEQVIDVNEPDEPPKKKKSPKGGKILLVMHEFQGVNTAILNNGTEILWQVHGGGQTHVMDRSIDVLVNPSIINYRTSLIHTLSKFKANLASKKTSDADLRPTKFTVVSLGIKASRLNTLTTGDSVPSNITGYHVYSLSQLTKKEYERLHHELNSTKAMEFTVSVTGSLMLGEDSYTEKLYNKLASAIMVEAERLVFTKVRSILKSGKFLSPKPLKLYDGGTFTGYGEKGDTETYDGTIQAFDGTDSTKQQSLDEDDFTRNPVFDTTNMQMNINRSGLHDMVIDETGLVRYDDLVRRVRKFKIPLMDRTIGCFIEPIQIIASGDSGMSVQLEFRGKVQVTNNATSKVSEDLYSTIDTVGVKLHKGQRITVLDSHLREPTKLELELQQATKKWNKTTGRR